MNFIFGEINTNTGYIYIAMDRNEKIVSFICNYKVSVYVCVYICITIQPWVDNINPNKLEGIEKQNSIKN